MHCFITIYIIIVSIIVSTIVVTIVATILIQDGGVEYSRFESDDSLGV